MVVGKTYKDVQDFDVKRHKEVGRKVFKDVDMRTRVKPVEKKEKGGGNNWRNVIDSHLEEDYDDKYEEY
jgi:hypothetical protein